MSLVSRSYVIGPVLGFALLAFSFLLNVIASPAKAHEFWIEPLGFTIESGARIDADNRIGQMLKGDRDPFIGSTFVRFTVTDADETRDVQGRLGDRPALKMIPKRDGLHIAAYQSTVSTVFYTEAEKFAGFVEKEGLDGVLEVHAQRGLPAEEFREGYTRFGKSLIAVGEGAGEDRPLGLRFELVALTNPYTDDGPMHVKLLLDGAPAPDVQVAAFRRDAEGTVTRKTLRTDTEGRATFPRGDAEMTLLSAVTMIEPKEALAKRKNLVWHSLWASLTYGR